MTMLNENENQSGQRRFFRDGAPYIDNFETVASLLIGKQPQQDLFIHTTLELIRAIHVHLSMCQEALGKTENLVEEARAENAPQERIDNLISLCRDLQALQTQLVDQVVESMNNVIENILPR